MELKLWHQWQKEFISGDHVIIDVVYLSLKFLLCSCHGNENQTGLPKLQQVFKK